MKNGQTLWVVKRDGTVSSVVVTSTSENELTVEYNDKVYTVPYKMINKKLFYDEDTAKKEPEKHSNSKDDNEIIVAKDVLSFESKTNVGGCGFNNGKSFGKFSPGRIVPDERY